MGSEQIVLCRITKLVKIQSENSCYLLLLEGIISWAHLNNKTVIILRIFLSRKESCLVIDLYKVKTSEPVDLLDGVDGNVALQEPGQLVNASISMKVSGKDIL